MKPNKNSVKAYNSIKPTLPEKEREVLRLVAKYGPINGRMLDVSISGAHKRIANLLEREVIAVAYNDMDPITGKDTAFYHATGKPSKAIQSIKKSKGIDLATFYDKAFRDGVRAALCVAVNEATDPIVSIEMIENTVNYICEVQK